VSLLGAALHIMLQTRVVFLPPLSVSAVVAAVV